MFIIILLLTHR